MKNLLLSGALALGVAFAFNADAQFRVVAPDGDCVAGGTSPGQANLKSLGGTAGVGEIDFAIDSQTGNPDFSLQVNDQTKGQAKYVINRQTMEFQVNAGSTSGGGLTGADFVAAFKSGGNVGIGTNSPAATLDVVGTALVNGVAITSDARTKENVSAYTTGLDAILALNPINFTYKSQYTDETERVRTGIMAQDLQKVAPELVTQITREYWDDSKGDGFEVLVEKEDILTIEPGGIIYILINALKDQQEQIKTLKAQIGQ